ncbi:hypothetical protein Tco_0449953, partial [Tanacetum coccineum]
MEQMATLRDLVDQVIQKKEEEKRISEEQAAKNDLGTYCPIQCEPEGIPDSMCDVPLCNNPTSLEALNEHSETIIDYNDDSTSSDDRFILRNIEYGRCIISQVESSALEWWRLLIRKLEDDFPDCEDSLACSIHMSFTSSASVWES